MTSLNPETDLRHVLFQRAQKHEGRRRTRVKKKMKNLLSCKATSAPSEIIITFLCRDITRKQFEVRILAAIKTILMKPGKLHTQDEKARLQSGTRGITREGGNPKKDSAGKYKTGTENELTSMENSQQREMDGYSRQGARSTAPANPEDTSGANNNRLNKGSR
jgi:hypothetical protein